MKSLKSALKMVLVGCLVFAAAGCKNNSITNPVQPDGNKSSSVAAQFMMRKQMAALKSAGVDVENVDVFFGLGWMPYYNGDDESRKIFSDAFAIAINNAALEDSNQVFSFDMGTVSLQYGQEKIELLKTEDEFGVFYDLFGPLSDDDYEDSTYVWEPKIQIPFQPGVAYRYEATGFGQIPSLGLDLNAPAELVQLTGPADGDSYTTGSDLRITWQGGVADDSIFVSIYPVFEYETDFEDVSDDSSGCGDHDSDEEFFHEGFVVVDAGAGEYTFSADVMAAILGQEQVDAIFVEIFALKETVVEKNNLTCVGEVHVGDMVELSVQ